MPVMNRWTNIRTGVLDSSLKVYGTTNLRACDASVFPIGIGTHLQSTVYAVAEKVSSYTSFCIPSDDQQLSDILKERGTTEARRTINSTDEI